MLLENLNIRVDRSLDYNFREQFGFEKAVQRAINEREKHLLSKEQLREKIKKGEAVLLNERDSEQWLFMYIDKSNPRCFIQIYNENMEPHFTYPWNGDKKISYADSLLGCTAFVDIKDVEIVATKKGNIAIKTKATLDLLFDRECITFFDKNGEPVLLAGAIDKGNIPQYVLDQKGQIDVMSSIKKYGDRFLDSYTDNSKRFVL